MADLTVGAGKTYSTIMAAHTAATAGDRVLVYYPDGVPAYDETFNISKALDIIAMEKGITLFSLGVNPLISHTSGTFRLVGFIIRFRVMGFDGTAGATSILDKNYIIPTDTIYFFYGLASVGDVYITNSVIKFSSSDAYQFLARNINSLNLYNNTIVNLRPNSAYFLNGYSTNSNVNAYNNIFINRSPYQIFFDVSNLNEDYNIHYNNANMANNQADGANDVLAANIEDTGLCAFQTGVGHEIDNYRTMQDLEVAGTTTANGVDLTTWDSGRLNTDIDGRTRTQYSIGCSEGFDVLLPTDYPPGADVRKGVVYAKGYSIGTAAIPTPNNVRETVPVDDTVGTLHVPIINESDVRAGVQF
jgi:hypothetical protein